MKDRIAALVGTLRQDGVAVSVAEAMDAAQAAAVAGVERAVLCDALAAALIKDERDRPCFLAAFAATFPAHARDVPRAAGRKRRSGNEPADGGAGASAARGDAASGSGQPATTPGTPARSAARPTPAAGSETEASREQPAPSLAATGTRPDTPRQARPTSENTGDPKRDEAMGGAPHARRHALLRLPFRAMTPADVEEVAVLARALAARVRVRLRRRLAPRPTGRLDFRRTIRAAVPRGGVPFERRFRNRRRDVPDLVALCDLSASTAIATDFFLRLLAPASACFRRVHLFGFVDRLVEIEFVAGQVRPAGPIDLMARSDFGRVLGDLVGAHASVLGADTVLLVLGDARNNRRPPRADHLARARARVRRVLWLNPDPVARWNTGDSVIAAYADYADAVVACGSLAELERALAAVARL